MKADIVIIGAGFAGASTAFHLGQLGVQRVLILDQEEIPGFHASGRNASLVLQSVSNPAVRAIVARSQRAYMLRSDQIGYEAVGSLLLGREEQLNGVRQTDLIPSEWVSPAEVRKRIPLLEGHQFDRALLTPGDGVMDVSRLLGFYLQGAQRSGHELRLNCRVEAIEKTAGGHFELSTSTGPVEAGLLINAGGAWAPEIARMVDLTPLPMRAFKRHLFILDGVDEIDPFWPFVWSLDKEFYFRPESGGLLFSVCDEEPSDHGFVQTVNPEMSERLAELISTELPVLEDSSERRVWSCFRTKTPDGNFHLGWSEDLSGFFWIAGLGGHGMGASWEVGRIAASSITRGPGKVQPASLDHPTSES